MPVSPEQVKQLQAGPTVIREKALLDFLRSPNRDPNSSPADLQPEGAAYLTSSFDKPVLERDSAGPVLKDQTQTVGDLASSANASIVSALRYKEAKRVARLQAESQARSERNSEILKGISESTIGGAFNDLSGPGYAAGGATGSRAAVIAAGKRWLGTMYQWGGGHGGRPATPKERVDCSGLVRAAFSAARIHGTDWMEGNTVTQVKRGRRVPISKLLPGDLIFGGSYSEPHHVAIYLGKGKILEAQQTGVPVKISNIRSGQFGVHLDY